MKFGMKIKKLNIESISWFSFSFYIFISTFANHTIFLHLATIFFMGITTLFVIKKKKIFFSFYFILSGAYIVYNIYLNKYGMVVDRYIASKMTRTLMINLIINYFLYNFMVLGKDMIKVLNKYMISVVYGMAMILFLFRASLSSGRISDGVTAYLFGQRLILNANGIGTIAAIACIVAIYLYLTSKNKKYIMYIVFLTLVTLLTGSRKALFFIIIGIVILGYIIYPQKRIRMLLLGSITGIFIYYLIMNVPLLYNIVGVRIEELIDRISTGKTNEASMNAREKMREIAIYYFKRRPLMGYGLDNYRILPKTFGVYSHDNNLELLVSGGIIGITIYYTSMLYVIIKLFLKNTKENFNKLFLIIILLIVSTAPWSVTYFERDYSFFILVACSFFKIYKVDRKNKKRRRRYA